MPPDDVAPVLLFSLLALVTGAVVIFRGPLGKAIARRIEGGVSTSPELETRLADLEQRLADSEHERAELAERVEFAERMLLQAKETNRELPR